MNSFHFILGEGEDVVDSKGKSVKVKKKKTGLIGDFVFSADHQSEGKQKLLYAR